MRFQTAIQIPADPARSKRLIAALVLLGATSAASAADYSGSINVDTKASHNDNIRLVETDQTQVYHYAVAPIVALEANTETTKMGLTSTLSFNRYDKSEFNSNDQDIQLNLTHDFENSSIGFAAGLVRDSTITSEVLTSGLIGNTAERTEQYAAAPSWMYTFNETNMLQVRMSYVVQDYQSNNYTGYTNIDGNVDWIHILTERLKVTLSGKYAHFEADDRSFEITALAPPPYPSYLIGQQSYYRKSKDKGAQLGMDYQWSEASLLQLRVGSSENTEQIIISDSQNICSDPFYLEAIAFGYRGNAVCESLPEESSRLSTAEASWTWKGERNQVNLRATKSTQPSSTGYVVDATRVASTWSYRLTERDRISADVALVRNRSIGQDSTRQNESLADRNYQSATLTYRRQFSEDWFGSASYQFNRQKYSQIDYQAESNVISLGITYKPQAWHWSR